MNLRQLETKYEASQKVVVQERKLHDRKLKTLRNIISELEQRVVQERDRANQERQNYQDEKRQREESNAVHLNHHAEYRGHLAQLKEDASNKVAQLQRDHENVITALRSNIRELEQRVFEVEHDA